MPYAIVFDNIFFHQLQGDKAEFTEFNTKMLALTGTSYREKFPLEVFFTNGENRSQDNYVAYLLGKGAAVSTTTWAWVKCKAIIEDNYFLKGLYKLKNGKNDIFERIVREKHIPRSQLYIISSDEVVIEKARAIGYTNLYRVTKEESAAENYTLLARIIGAILEIFQKMISDYGTPLFQERQRREEEQAKLKFETEESSRKKQEKDMEELARIQGQTLAKEGEELYAEISRPRRT